MRSNQLSLVMAFIITLALSAILSVGAVDFLEERLFDTSAWTGWVLFVGFIALASLNLRKRLAGLPIISVRFWLRFHIIASSILFGVFWAHAGFWPMGFYEQILTALIYVLFVGGFVGLVLQKVLPVRLNQIGLEVVYEEIPTRIHSIQKEITNYVRSVVIKNPNSVLSDHYFEVLAPFLSGPSNFWAHLIGGNAPKRWRMNKAASIDKYLDAQDQDDYEKILLLIDQKISLDSAYAHQSIMKYWLFFHVPLSAVTILLIFWHVFVVHLYVI